jgi:hypothetical protein
MFVRGGHMSVPKRTGKIMFRRKRDREREKDQEIENGGERVRE